MGHPLGKARACRLSIQSWEISSIVSANARTIKAKLVIHSATKPTPVPIPREENRINAHTSAGILRIKVATARTALAARGKGDTLSLANSETKKARIPATVVEEIAIAMVVSTLLRILVILEALEGSSGGKKSCDRKLQKFSPF